MNIFWLDEDPWDAARLYCDRHVSKINVEINQMISTALRRHGYNWDCLYEPVMENHPLVRWVGDSEQNFEEVVIHANALGDEFHHRYGSVHSSFADVTKEIGGREVNFPNLGLTERPQCMPQRFKVEGDYVKAYRRFYNHGKDWDMKWTSREVPSWYTEGELQ